MNNNADFTVDAKQVVNMFANLTSKEQKRSYRDALRRSGRTLLTATKQTFRKIYTSKVARSKNWWNGKTLESGIRMGMESYECAQVNILGDFRLKFFEMGTRTRYTTGKRTSGRYTKTNRTMPTGLNRGSIKGTRFFDATTKGKEREIFRNLDAMIAQSIQRTAAKSK